MKTCQKQGCNENTIPRGKYCETHRTPRRKPCTEPGCPYSARSGYDYCKGHGGGKRCIDPGCPYSAVSPSDYCIGHGGGKRCIDPGCPYSARPSSEYCIGHGGGRRCIDPGCPYSAVSPSEYCKGHGGGRRCIEPECPYGARPSSEYCVGHGGGRRCIEPECPYGARPSSDYCVGHGGGKRCIDPGCPYSAVSPSEYCVGHGGGRRCIDPGCPYSAVSPSEYCIGHGGGRRCIDPGCPYSAVSPSEYCIGHGGGRRCPNCIDWIDSRSGSARYDGYCATCFKRVFPDDPRSTVVYEHTKEIRVRNAIAEHSETNFSFSGFIHDRPLYTGNCDCTHRRRVDHRKLFGNTILAIETDENQHRGYDMYDEEIRYDDLFMVHSGKWIFIRFNPDNTRNIKVDIEDRIQALLEEIERQIERIASNDNSELVEIVKLFYDY
jgi:hypothetical protein